MFLEASVAVSSEAVRPVTKTHGTVVFAAAIVIAEVPAIVACRLVPSPPKPVVLAHL